ncbi:HAD family hydrolase [Paucisalibacillus globulus]|uniref:HAD family hydrolase n=1 Tax=Paucisalibacillus globulus TaxID=351095 RepID=UPI000BB846C3|nr:HAD family hydrolase [Paucisalibacillus globulus]
MIKAVLFDLDGTLLNRDASVKHFIESQYDRLIEYLSHIPQEQYISRFLELDNKGYVWKDIVYQQLTEEFYINLITWEALLQDYMEQFHKNCIPFPNLKQTLTQLKSKSIRIGVITNGLGQFQMDNIRALGIESLFDVILISEWEGIKKPNQAIFRKALSELGVAPHESIYIGDHPINDVKAANNAGMISVLKRDDTWSCDDADFIIDDLSEVLKLT